MAIPTDSKEGLKELIEKSSLIEEDRNFWFGFLEQMEQYKDSETKESIQKGLGYILTYLQEEPNKLQWLTGILRRKVEAMDKLDKKAWEEVLREEEAGLKQ